MIKDSGNRREFETGAVRDIQEGKGRYDLMPMEALRRLAVHCENGAKKYGERNCEKGIPVSSLADSAMRHLCKYISGADDEDHLTAAFWNIAFIMEMEKNHKELCNLPRYKCTPIKHLSNVIKEELGKESCGTCRYYGYDLKHRETYYCKGCSAPEYKNHSTKPMKITRKEDPTECQEETQI